MNLDTPVSQLIGVGPRKAGALARLGIKTIYDLLHHYPTSYTFAPPPGPLVTGQPGTILGKVVRITSGWGDQQFSCMVATCIGEDYAGHINITWFHGQYVRNLVHTGVWIVATGVANEYGLTNPTFNVAPRPELLNHENLNRPTYSVTKGVTSKDIERYVGKVLDYLASSGPIVSGYLWSIHRPDTQLDYGVAVQQAKYEELFYMQLGLAVRKAQRDQEPPNVQCHPVMIDIYKYFPFQFTHDQKHAASDIIHDLCGSRAMNRLLQGDVGSGKTAVAAYAAMLVAMNGGQTAILCPTQILAKQHYESIKGLFEAAGLKCRLNMGGTPSCGEYHTDDVVVGTTSILTENTWFTKLGLVVVDEQHKFGVEQRAALRKHGNPHMLMMTATPIPRTIAMTAFGDLDISTIKTMPPGRLPVKTHWVRDTAIGGFMATLESELLDGRQVYVVCPRIEALDDEMRAVEEVWQEYMHRFSGASVGYLHGKMTPTEKKQVEDWWNGPCAYGRILVSTTVIEVGVDNPNATVMVVEGAERFGLAQLHQLRGRVGRGKDQSYCFLVSDTDSAEARSRLKAMENTNDGFEIAEADLKLRGPGDLLSTRQHGLPDLKIADLLEDFDVLVEAQSDARECAEAGLSQADIDELERRWPGVLGGKVD